MRVAEAKREVWYVKREVWYVKRDVWYVYRGGLVR